MDEAAVTESREGSGPVLDRIAVERGLSRAEEGRLPVFFTAVGFSSRPARHIVGGELAPGLRGLIADLVIEVGNSEESPPAEVHATVLITRVPEAAGFLPLLACHDADRRDLASRLIGPGGLIKLYKQVELESIAFNRRYRIGIGRRSDENRMRQLFSPTFIDWLAERAPEGFVFELSRGQLSVATTRPPTDVESVDRFCGFAARVADRIRSEALESRDVPGEARPSPPPADVLSRHRLLGFVIAAGFAALLAGVITGLPLFFVLGFGAPPGPTAAAFGGLFLLVFAMLLISFLRGQSRHWAALGRFDRLMRRYARERDLTLEDPASFVARFARLPVLGVPHAVLSGELPDVGEASLVAFIDLDATGRDRRRYTVALVARSGVPVPSVVAWPRAPSKEVEVIGGFPVHEAKGHVAGRAPARVPAAIAERFDVVIDGEGDDLAAGERVAASAATRAWLLDERRAGRCGLAMDGDAIALYAERNPDSGWSADDLDDFCKEASTGLAAVRATLR